MSIVKIQKNLTPRENILNLIKESNKDNPLIQELQSDSFIITGIISNSAFGSIVVDGVEIRLNSAVSLIGNPVKGWTGAKTIKYRRVDLADWQYPDIVGNASSRIPRETIADALGLEKLPSTKSTNTLPGVSMTIDHSGSNVIHWSNAGNDWAYKEYLNLHQGLKVSSSSGGNVSIVPATNDFEADTSLSSKALYTGVLTLYVS